MIAHLRARLAPPRDLEKTLHGVDLDKPALLADLGIGLGQCAEQFERGAGRSGVVGHRTMVARQVRPTMAALAPVPERPKGTACKAVQSRVQIPPGARQPGGCRSAAPSPFQRCVLAERCYPFRP